MIGGNVNPILGGRKAAPEFLFQHEIIQNLMSTILTKPRFTIMKRILYLQTERMECCGSIVREGVSYYGWKVIQSITIMHGPPWDTAHWENRLTFFTESFFRLLFSIFMLLRDVFKYRI